MNTTSSMHPLLSSKDRLDRRLVEHQRFDDAVKRIVSHIIFPTDTKIIWVIGPTGVGKSRLADRIRRYILADPAIADKIKNDPGCVPSVSFEVPCNSSNHQFAWRPFFNSYLDQLKSPFIPTDRSLSALPDADPRRGPEYLVLNALQHRRPLLTLLDEANHFANVASGKVLLEQMTRIKSFVNRTNVLHVFFGTYDLAPLTMLSGQLARRADIIHFGRYRAEVEEDIKAFVTVVRNFQEMIPVAHHYDLATRAMYLHERTLGCVGTLKTWLVRALAHAYADGRKAIQHADLEATALDIHRLSTMLDEAIIGENRMMKAAKLDVEVFRGQLGHTKGAQEPNERERDLWGQAIDGGTVAKGRKPFEPLPYRHPVGSDGNQCQRAS